MPGLFLKRCPGNEVVCPEKLRGFKKIFNSKRSYLRLTSCKNSQVLYVSGFSLNNNNDRRKNHHNITVGSWCQTRLPLFITIFMLSKAAAYYKMNQLFCT